MDHCHKKALNYLQIVFNSAILDLNGRDSKLKVDKFGRGWAFSRECSAEMRRMTREL